MNSTECSVIGIDVSSDWFDACSDKGEARFENNKRGIGKFIKWIRRIETPFVVIEATGHYHMQLQEMLSEAGNAHAVVNPRQVRDFAKSMGILAKTDKIDARTIKLFGEKKELDRQARVPREIKVLRALVTRRQQLTEMITQEQNRIAATSDVEMLNLVRQHIRFLQLQKRTLDKEIKSLLNHSSLRSHAQIMISAIGVATQSAAVFSAFLPELGRTDKATIASLAGCAPHPDDSGYGRKRRVVSGGRRPVTRALYMCALVASRHSPRMRRFYQGLLARGKAKKVALLAVARKLIITLNAMMRDRKMYSEMENKKLRVAA